MTTPSPDRTEFRKLPRSVQFRREREDEWKELERLVNRGLRGGLGFLSREDAKKLPRLYRNVLSSLLVARKTAMDRELVAYLDALSARAYLVVYGSRVPVRWWVVRFLFEDFPAALRRIAVDVLASAAIFVLGVVVAFLLFGQHPGWYYAFVDPNLAAGRTPSADTKFLRNVLYDSGEMLGTFSSFLFAHNARIGLLAFVVGIAGGVPSALLVFSNGLMLGAFLALYADRGLLVPMLGWILPHGVPELTAIVLCAGAGMAVGRGLLLPGRRSVGAAIARQGRDAATVVAGAVLLFAVAGIVEGAFRQLVQNDTIRFALAAFNGLWLTGWFALAVRRPGSAATRNSPAFTGLRDDPSGVGR